MGTRPPRGKRRDLRQVDTSKWGAEIDQLALRVQMSPPGMIYGSSPEGIAIVEGKT